MIPIPFVIVGRHISGLLLSLGNTDQICHCLSETVAHAQGFGVKAHLRARPEPRSSLCLFIHPEYFGFQIEWV